MRLVFLHLTVYGTHTLRGGYFSHVQGVQPNEMKVHRLRDPERGQMRLNFVGNAASANNGEDENED